MIANISIEYNEKEKELYIAEENSSGCIYLHIEKEDISSYVKSYIDDFLFYDKDDYVILDSKKSIYNFITKYYELNKRT